MPVAVLIDRKDPEESFTYLKEQAIRLSDKIEAMLLNNEHRRSPLSSGPRASTPKHSSSSSSSGSSIAKALMERGNSSSDTDEVQDVFPPPPSPTSSLGKSSSPWESPDGARLLKNFHIHIKSSASVSGLRQRQRKALLRCSTSLNEGQAKEIERRDKCASCGWEP